MIADHEDDSASGEDNVNIHDDLSGDTLAALLQFMHGKDMLLTDEPEDDAPPIITAKNNNVIAETFRRLEEQKEAVSAAREKRIDNQVLEELEYTSKDQTRGTPAAILISDGIVRLESVLSSDLCDECLKRINAELLVADHNEETAMYDCNGFGKVHSRACRYDMYLQNDGVFKDALHEMLCHGSALESLFTELFSGIPAVFHEFSALISDPGSFRQPIHPDSKFTPKAVLYSCFVALQDVNEDMGPTWFLPLTNTQDSHDKHNNSDEAFSMSCDYRKASLRKGEVAIMDSRTLHCGGPNISESTRRVLLYFTLRDPEHSSLEKDFPPNGSKWPNLHMEHTDFD